MNNETKERLVAEVARIIGLPIIPMQPTAVHDSKPFPHLVQHGNGRFGQNAVWQVSGHLHPGARPGFNGLFAEGQRSFTG